jgi:hypothetical protein
VDWEYLVRATDAGGHHYTNSDKTPKTKTLTEQRTLSYMRMEEG